ncbi:MAG: hypothetical protein WCP68_01745 [Enhydrobacter sp.]
MASVSKLTTTHRGHRIEIQRFEWGYTGSILAGDGRFTVASASAFRALADALAIVDDWAVSSRPAF